MSINSIVIGQTLGESNTVEDYLDNTWSANVVSGRVSTLELPGSGIASVEVTGGLDYGNVTVNPDNSLAVVLTGTTSLASQSFDIKITGADGSVSEQTVALNVSAGRQDAGWGTGKFYMLETDDQDNLVIEHGENHRKVYLSGSEDALTKADIAALEDLDVSDITGSWLENHPEYGGSEDMALAQDAAKSLWVRITGTGTEPSSNWLLLERGFEYDDMSLVDRGTVGESELNPIYIGAYGEGDRPLISSAVNIAQDASKNIVIQGLEFSDKVTVMNADNIAINDVSSTGGFNLQSLEQLTLRNTDITELYAEEPNGTDTEIWSPHINRATGIYLSKSEGVLFEGLFIDQVGWEDDYRTDLSLEGGQPPSIYSHNMYITNTVTDFTLRDSISTQGAGSAALIRAGGYVEDNVFIDSNAGVAVNGGENDAENGTRSGNYTLYNGNVITSGAHRTVDFGPKGALTGGLDNRGYDTTIVDSIVTHLADPDNPQEHAAKTVTHQSYVELLDSYYNELITYNWDRSTNNNPDDDLERNVEGLDRSLLDETTIQRFTSALLGRDHDTNPATISDLADYLRDQADDGAYNDVVDADVINDYFKAAFGIDTTIRTEADTLRFIPNDLSDGVRWDNRLNWETGDLPGTQDGDSVDLGGNWVHYSGTTTLEALDFGDSGKLAVGQGYLEIENGLSVGDAGATLEIDRAGQFWTNGYTDPDRLVIEASGGRFANTGLFTGTMTLNVSDNAQVILASDNADFVLNNKSSLNIFGDDAKVGFDGNQGGTGVLLLGDEATLSFTAEDGKVGTIREFYSGAYDADKNILSGVNLGGSDLFLDLTGIDISAVYNVQLIKVDELIGTFDEVTFKGLGNNQDASIIVDYETDTVELNIGVAGQGSGARNIYTNGLEADAMASADLWAALTKIYDIRYEEKEPARILIEGTEATDQLFGTAADEWFFGNGGHRDSIKTGDGNDTIVFGSETLNGMRDVTLVQDFSVDQDVIALAEGTSVVGHWFNSIGNLVLDLSGDGDRIVFRNDVDFDDLAITPYPAPSSQPSEYPASLPQSSEGSALPEPFEEPARILIEGTEATDQLFGTAADEWFFGNGGHRDSIKTGDGNDTIVFGSETLNGMRDVTLVQDFSVDQDVIALAEGTSVVGHWFNSIGNLVLDLSGDGDRIVFRNDVDFDDLAITPYPAPSSQPSEYPASLPQSSEGSALPEPFEEPARILIEGTEATDQLFGTAADEWFFGNGGHRDSIKTGDGNDTIVFGSETLNGMRDVTLVQDFSVDQDVIALAEGTSVVGHWFNSIGNLVLDLSGDGDRIVFRNDVDFDDLAITPYDYGLV